MSQTKRLISMKVVMQMTSLSRSEINRREGENRFPKRIALSPHPRGRKAWVESEVQDYVLKHIQARSD